MSDQQRTDPIIGSPRVSPHHDPELFRLLCDSVLDCLWCFDVANPEADWVSPAFCQVVGWRDDEIENAAACRRETIFPDDLALEREVMQECFLSDEGTYDHIARYRHRDKSTRWIRTIGVVKRDASGRAVQFLAKISDVTRLKLAEIESEKQSSLLHEAEKISASGAWEWIPSNDEWRFSDGWHEIHGTRERALTTAELLTLAHPEDKEKIDKAFAATLNGTAPYNIEHRIVRKDNGEVRFVRATGRVFRNRAGDVERVLGIARDITESKRTQDQLEEKGAALERSNQELLQLSYRTSHDLKSPLTTIKGLAAFVADDIESGRADEAKKNAKVIADEAERLEQLVLDLLALAQADLKEESANTVKLASLMDAVEFAHRLSAQQQKVALKFEVDQSGECRLPESRVYQVLTNLVSNGIRYSDPNKPHKFVRVELKEHKGQVELRVTDNGLGIPSKNKADIFRMFTRFHAREHAGSGIGMYIVKKHVDEMKGTVDYSTSNEGTSFLVKLDSNQWSEREK